MDYVIEQETIMFFKNLKSKDMTMIIGRYKRVIMVLSWLKYNFYILKLTTKK